MAAMNRADAQSREALQLAMRQFMAAWEGDRDAISLNPKLNTAQKPEDEA